MKYLRFPLIILTAFLTLAAALSQAVTINWFWDASPSAGVTGYKMYRGDIGTTGGPYPTSNDAGNALTYIWTEALPDGNYPFVATAYGQCDDGQGGTVPCESGPSNEVIYTVAQAGDTTPPSTPGTPSFSGTTSTQTTLTWTASTDNVAVTGYRVERCQGAGCVNFAEIAQPATNSYPNTGLTASTTYLYRVRATDAALNLSSYSASASVTTAAGAVPVAAWAFSEGSGTTSADATGNNHTMTLQGGATWIAGHTANGLNFSGTGQYATTPHVADLSLTSTGALEAWIFLSALSRWHGVISKGTANSDQSHNYAMEVTNANVPNCVLGNGSSAVVVAGVAAIPLNTWTHLACTWDGTTVRLYRDGSNVASGSQTLTPVANTAPLSLGQFGASSDRMQGRIDDVRVWNVARSAAEIVSDMNTPVGAVAPAATTISTINWTQP